MNSSHTHVQDIPTRTAAACSRSCSVLAGRGRSLRSLAACPCDSRSLALTRRRCSPALLTHLSIWPSLPCTPPSVGAVRAHPLARAALGRQRRSSRGPRPRRRLARARSQRLARGPGSRRRRQISREPRSCGGVGAHAVRSGGSRWARRRRAARCGGCPDLVSNGSGDAATRS